MSTTVGQQLRQAREARSLTLDQVAHATRIRVHYLKALEAGEFKSLPSMAQARGFLRTYAGYLRLDVEPLLTGLNGEKPSAGPIPEAVISEPPSEASQNALEHADAIFVQIGRSLQRQRELLVLSLDDVERHTHLRQHYLKALEAGNLEGLPSPVQGRGMLNNYAAFLGLDPEPLLLLFADGLQSRLAARQAARPEPPPVPVRRTPIFPAPLRRFLSGDILIGGTLVVFLMVFMFWGAIRIFATKSVASPTPTAPSIADVLLASATATASTTPAPPSPTASGPQLLFPTQVLATDALTGNLIPPNAQNGVQIYLNVLQRAWMQVTVDGKVEFDGTVIPGGAYPFTGKNQVEIITGNGAGLEVYFNGADMGAMGTFGEVVDRIYSPQGILIPTATAAPSPTITRPVTPTRPVIGTPSPSPVNPPALP